MTMSPIALAADIATYGACFYMLRPNQALSIVAETSIVGCEHWV
jgi:hypothetical protein